MSETGKTAESGYITASEAAQKLGYRYEPFIRALRNGRVPGAKKHGRFWMVPEDSEVRSKYRYLTSEEHEELVRLATSGVPKKELAARFGMSVWSVYKILQRERKRRETSTPAR